MGPVAGSNAASFVNCSRVSREFPEPRRPGAESGEPPETNGSSTIWNASGPWSSLPAAAAGGDAEGRGALRVTGDLRSAVLKSRRRCVVIARRAALATERSGERKSSPATRARHRPCSQARPPSRRTAGAAGRRRRCRAPIRAPPGWKGISRGAARRPPPGRERARVKQPGKMLLAAWALHIGRLMAIL